MTGVFALITWLTTTREADDSRLTLGMGYIVTALMAVLALVALRSQKGVRRA